MGTNYIQLLLMGLAYFCQSFLLTDTVLTPTLVLKKLDDLFGPTISARCASFQHPNAAAISFKTFGCATDLGAAC